ncbi:MAG: hypothetical protein HW412_868 [Bacteroidetes bacterium]|nr:hypothetical protein [Bacteroidota bacterium]
MIKVNGQMLLGELKLIESALFFKSDPDAASRFVDGVSRQGRLRP